jgi:hypothetical protein
MIFTYVRNLVPRIELSYHVVADGHILFFRPKIFLQNIIQNSFYLCSQTIALSSKVSFSQTAAV